MQILTVKCKLKPTREEADALDRTLEQFAQASCFAIRVGRENNLSNNFKIHKLCYKSIREEIGLSANLAVRAIARAAGILKVKERKHSIVKPTSADFDARIFSFDESDWSVSLRTAEGRIKLALKIGRYQCNLLKGQEPKSAVLSKTRKGDYCINIQVKVEESPKISNEGGYLGVDLGIKRIAVTSLDQKWDGKQLNQTRDRFARVRAALQRKKTQKRKAKRTNRSLRRLQKRLRGRERRFQQWTNHNISKTIVNTAKEHGRTIRLEDLKGIRERAKVGKKQRRTHYSWAFHQLQQQIRYKAALAGVRVELVNPKYTSQQCSQCHTLGSRKGLRFNCLNSNCGVELDADLNGSFNIAAGGAIVTRPETRSPRDTGKAA